MWNKINVEFKMKCKIIIIKENTYYNLEKVGLQSLDFMFV